MEFTFIFVHFSLVTTQQKTVQRIQHNSKSSRLFLIKCWPFTVFHVNTVLAVLACHVAELAWREWSRGCPTLEFHGATSDSWVVRVAPPPAAVTLGQLSGERCDRSTVKSCGGSDRFSSETFYFRLKCENHTGTSFTEERGKSFRVAPSVPGAESPGSTAVTSPLPVPCRRALQGGDWGSCRDGDWRPLHAALVCLVLRFSQ